MPPAWISVITGLIRFKGKLQVGHIYIYNNVFKGLQRESALEYIIH